MDEGGRRRRRMHSEQFKAEAIVACRKPGASIAAAALERSINANLLRRWVIDAERAEAGSLLPMKPAAVAPAERFVALALSTQPSGDTPIKIKVRRGAMTLSVLGRFHRAYIPHFQYTPYINGVARSMAIVPSAKSRPTSAAVSRLNVIPAPLILLAAPQKRPKLGNAALINPN